RVRLHLPSAPGSGAALCRGLRASSRRYHRPTGQIQQPERTLDWIKLGGKVRCLAMVINHQLNNSSNDPCSVEEERSATALTAVYRARRKRGRCPAELYARSHREL